MKKTELVLVEVTYDPDEYPTVEHVLWGTSPAPGTTMTIINTPAKGHPTP